LLILVKSYFGTGSDIGLTSAVKNFKCREQSGIGIRRLLDIFFFISR